METQMKRTCAIPIAPLGCGREGRHSRRNVQERELALQGSPAEFDVSRLTT